tara:strand:- start:221 stop:331 length:111 start_codon:yes stop_codon:yes gene_type:complete
VQEDGGGDGGGGVDLEFLDCLDLVRRRRCVGAIVIM